MLDYWTFAKPVIRAAVREFAAYKFVQFERNTKHPQQAFERLWLETYNVLVNSSYWKAHGLRANLNDNAITEYETYRQCFDAGVTPQLETNI